MLIVKISSKNQITLPKQLLGLLGVNSGDRLFLEQDKEKITLQPLKKNITESLVGSIQVKPSLRAVPFEEVLKKTKKMVARKLK